MERCMSTAVAKTDVPRSKTLDQYAKAINAAHGKSVELIFVIAENLSLARAELSHPGDKNEGKFLAWVEDNCAFTHRTATNYLLVKKAFEGKPIETVSRGFDVSALYYLAKDTTPEEATEVAIERAKSGERITAKTAKAIAEEFTITAQVTQPTLLDDAEDDYDDDDDDDESLIDQPMDLASDGWDQAACAIELRPHIARWALLCPSDRNAELSAILRDLASQVDNGVWNG
jgi:hypothetical protein